MTLLLSRYPWQKAILAMVFIIDLLGATSCARQLHVSLQSSPCLNPPDGYCDEEGNNSRVLDIAIYQLRAPIDLESVLWEDFFSDPHAPEGLQDYLSDPQLPRRSSHLATLENNNIQELQIRRLWRTRQLLLVTLGRDYEVDSIYTTPLYFLPRRRSFCFEYYSISTPTPYLKWRDGFTPSNCNFAFSFKPLQDS